MSFVYTHILHTFIEEDCGILKQGAKDCKVHELLIDGASVEEEQVGMLQGSRSPSSNTYLRRSQD